MRSTAVLPRWADFGQLVRERRLASGMTSRELARQVAISPSYMLYIERARVPPPSNEVIDRLANILDVPAVRLLALAGRLPPHVLEDLWRHPAVPPILSTIPGMSLDDAQTFCRQATAPLPD